MTLRVRVHDLDSLECFSRHCEVVILLWLWQALEIHQAGVQFLVVISELEEWKESRYWIK